jgi:hypothetical protein
MGYHLRNIHVCFFFRVVFFGIGISGGGFVFVLGGIPVYHGLASDFSYTYIHRS